MTAKKTPARKTTRSRAKKETVAEEATRENTAVDTPSGVVEEPAPSVETEPAASNDMVALTTVNDTDKGFCDNHPDRRAIVVTDFPWTPPQRFCNLCVPQQYRFLLP